MLEMRCWVSLVDAEIHYLLKISKSQKQIMKSRILLKNEGNTLRILTWVCFLRFFWRIKNIIICFRDLLTFSCQLSLKLKWCGITSLVMLVVNKKKMKWKKETLFTVSGSFGIKGNTCSQEFLLSSFFPKSIWGKNRKKEQKKTEKN